MLTPFLLAVGLLYVLPIHGFLISAVALLLLWLAIGVVFNFFFQRIVPPKLVRFYPADRPLELFDKRQK